MNTSKHCILVLTISTLLASCATTSREESSAAARGSLPETPDAWAAAQENVGEVQIGWLARLEDETLATLVEEAQLNNRDLRAAATNIDSSWALAKQAGAALKPSLGLSAGGTRSGTVESPMPDATQFNVGLQASWEIDLWGRIRAGKQAAVASAEAAEADYRFSQHSLAASVTRAYFIAIEAGRLTGVARDTVAALTETNRIVKVRYDNGVANSQDLALSNSDLATARSSLAASEGAQRNALRALEVLLGRYPGADMEVRTTLPDTPAAPPAGVPSEILERRPDLVAAERRVAAAFNKVDEAKAARLPSISLTGNIGGSSPELSSLLNPANLAWSLGTSLVAPLLDGGAGRAAVEAATANQQAAIARYGQTALTAFQEVENSLDQSLVLRSRDKALDEAAAQANEALRVAQVRYDAGEIAMLDLLTIQQRVFSADSNFVSIQRARLENWVNLNLSLGGSWE